MRQNKIKKMMHDGKSVINGWLQLPSSFSAEIMANQGLYHIKSENIYKQVT